MPGANCSIFGCSISRKNKGISIFRIPTGLDEFNSQWRAKIIDIITRDRVVDSSLKKQIDDKSLYTCELHYSDECLIRNETKTTRIPGSLPTLNLPKKSFSKDNNNERSSSSIIKRELAIESSSTSKQKKETCYKSINDFIQRAKSLKLSDGWILKIENEKLSVVKLNKIYVIPQFEIVIHNTLNYEILVYNWLVPNSNIICTKYSSSLKTVTLSSLIKEINDAKICKGVSYKTDYIECQSVPKTYIAGNPNQVTEFNRPKDCLLICNDARCSICYVKDQQHLQYLKRKESKLQEPAKVKAPVTLTSPERLRITMQNYRFENKELKKQIEKLQSELQRSSITTSSSLNNDLVHIMSSADPSKISPFMKFFWEQQQKYLQSSSNGVRYHPAIIRYCLSLASKSSSAYDDIRYNEKTGTGFLILPSQRRLRDYKNYIRPQRGFNSEIVKELQGKIVDFSESEKFVVLLFDEMKIQENLVWDKHSGELIGYVDLGDVDVNLATFNKVNTVATHVLVIMVRSIINPFKFSLANFATTGASATQLFTLFWKAVSILELTCKLKVLAATCDGAPTNRKFFQMHSRFKQENVSVDGIIYKTKNKYSFDGRYIYFIADQPHLLKTARNGLKNSGAGKSTRYLWNNGSSLLWSHIAHMFYEDLECGLHLLPKLTYDHIKLTSYSVMNVRLAAQVLSYSVSKVLSEYGPPEAQETARYCFMMDSFFDIVNIRNKTEYITKAKPNLEPFSSPEDPRLSWLLNDFLGYFYCWKSSVENRPGNFDKVARSRMFIPRQTHDGLKITVHSIVECVKFLLENNICSYVLTERFCQDPLENYFGRQRSLGARKDNPTIRDVGFNDNTIRNQKVFRPIAAGNCVDEASVVISNEPIPCRKKPRTK